MTKSLHTPQRHPPLQFHLTAMIDVIFILITFFMLICRSIGRENFKLTLPDDCPTAVVADQPDQNAITVSVFPSPDRQSPQPSVLYAVRDHPYDLQNDIYQGDPFLLIDAMTEHLTREAQLKGDSLVYLRADKNLTYGDVQNALLALARARIKTVHLAAYRIAQPTETMNQELK
jgi:biopolymer transport protein ExbD